MICEKSVVEQKGDLGGRLYEAVLAGVWQTRLQRETRTVTAWPMRLQQKQYSTGHRTEAHNHDILAERKTWLTSADIVSA